MTVKLIKLKKKIWPTFMHDNYTRQKLVDMEKLRHEIICCQNLFQTLQASRDDVMLLHDISQDWYRP